MAHWIFQANPKHFDIDGALRELDSIVWRVPQHTAAIEPEDTALVWRSGKEAGVVAVARVQSKPHLADVGPAEKRFVTDPTEGKPETRVVLSVARVPFVSKEQWADNSSLGQHQIVRAPMGTVFRLSPDEWAAAVGMHDHVVVPAFAPVEVATSDLPPIFGWKDRKKDVYPLPGGRTGYLDTLRKIGQYVGLSSPSEDTMRGWLQSELELSVTSARLTSSFLRRAGFIAENRGHLEVGDVLARYIADEDPSQIIGQLHSRTRFIGELLALIVDQPMTLEEILTAGNDQFELGWTTNAQVQRRRGWLQSAGLIEEVDDGLRTTEAGLDFLDRVELHAPANSKVAADTVSSASQATSVSAPTGSSTLSDLIERLRTTSRDSENADAFEFAIRDAFEFLGFRAEKVGGSGKTDVVADADLGRDASYRIIIDGKTTKRGAIADGRIDWDTIDDHRQIHQADFVVIAGPEFSGGERLRLRAAKHDALLMSVGDLVALIRQHSESLVGLDEYRDLLGQAEFDIDLMAPSTEARARSLEVAKAALQAIEQTVGHAGPMSARDLFLVLNRVDSELPMEEDEIQNALDALANPLIGALVCDDDGRSYRPTGPRVTALSRLNLLHSELAALE